MTQRDCDIIRKHVSLLRFLQLIGKYLLVIVGVSLFMFLEKGVVPRTNQTTVYTNKYDFYTQSLL